MSTAGDRGWRRRCDNCKSTKGEIWALDGLSLCEDCAEAYAPEPPRPPTRWPEPLAEAALHGLPGRFVRTVAPHSEADPAALLGQFLIAAGNVIGPGPAVRVEGDRHRVNEYGLMVGETAKARKGVSWGRTAQVAGPADPEWLRERVMSGLASGEGVIWNVRDPIVKRRKAKNKAERAEADEDGMIEVVEDAGVKDKRLLVHEAEFAHVLKVMGRDGNTLSPSLRALWDTGNRSGLTKNDPVRTTGAHVSVIGHITADELRASLTSTERANGFANRFLIFCVKRSKFLPFGGNLDPGALARLSKQVGEAVESARTTGELSWGLASQLWEDVYPDLSAGAPGMLGAITARAEAHVLRLAVIYALLDQRRAIEPEHLRAALAVWRYCEDSAAYVFGGTLGYPLADRLIVLIWETGTSGITRGELRDKVSHKYTTDEFDTALAFLLRRGLTTVERELSSARGGRPPQRWFANPFSPQGEETPVSGEETPAPEARASWVSSPQTPVSSPSDENGNSGSPELSADLGGGQT